LLLPVNGTTETFDIWPMRSCRIDFNLEAWAAFILTLKTAKSGGRPEPLSVYVIPETDQQKIRYVLDDKAHNPLHTGFVAVLLLM
jgi:hypothetical protein